MKRKLAALAAVALAAASLVSGSQAGALTGWKTFGSSTARGVGVLGRDAQGTLVFDLVVVGMDSTTKANPKRLRFVATGPETGKAHIEWYLDCWDPGADFRVTSGTIAATRLPRTVDLSNKVGGVSNWTRCTAGVRVDYPADGFRPTAGVVRVVLQARYA